MRPTTTNCHKQAAAEKASVEKDKELTKAQAAREVCASPLPLH